ncbi:MAG: hypothetical protein WA728_14910 [Xanthobacteraceae bacterium]
MIYVNRDDRKQLELNLSILSNPNNRKATRIMVWEDLMPRFYFNLVSRDNRIPDNGGKELASLNDAHAHARTLIDKILFHVGHDDAAEWKVVVSNDDHDAQMTVPFPVSAVFRRQRRGAG